MGLREGYKDKYYLYNHRRLKMCSVIPLAEDVFNIGNYAGMHFQKVFNGNVTKEELNKLNVNINCIARKNYNNKPRLMTIYFEVNHE